ncbi:hypothetical protein Agub_g13605 [Astrephomene gubernaculifera]|uniref:Uncharacterized protein n=1 Tax=Astrephomene gubernaculifera TaxID=47775 RepID=A0AAD3HSR0_9CHLO|nr:hypothetical protein Agub_g13605 [Astrephomene gubernaculifera]
MSANWCRDYIDGLLNPEDLAVLVADAPAPRCRASSGSPASVQGHSCVLGVAVACGNGSDGSELSDSDEVTTTLKGMQPPGSFDAWLSMNCGYGIGSCVGQPQFCRMTQPASVPCKPEVTAIPLECFESNSTSSINASNSTSSTTSSAAGSGSDLASLASPQQQQPRGRDLPLSLLTSRLRNPSLDLPRDSNPNSFPDNDDPDWLGLDPRTGVRYSYDAAPLTALVARPVVTECYSYSAEEQQLRRRRGGNGVIALKSCQGQDYNYGKKPSARKNNIYTPAYTTSAAASATPSEPTGIRQDTACTPAPPPMVFKHTAQRPPLHPAIALFNNRPDATPAAATTATATAVASTGSRSGNCSNSCEVQPAQQPSSCMANTASSGAVAATGAAVATGVTSPLFPVPSHAGIASSSLSSPHIASIVIVHPPALARSNSLAAAAAGASNSYFTAAQSACAPVPTDATAMGVAASITEAAATSTVAAAVNDTSPAVTRSSSTGGSTGPIAMPMVSPFARVHSGSLYLDAFSDGRGVSTYTALDMAPEPEYHGLDLGSHEPYGGDSGLTEECVHGGRRLHSGGSFSSSIASRTNSASVATVTASAASATAATALGVRTAAIAAEVSACQDVYQSCHDFEYRRRGSRRQQQRDVSYDTITAVAEARTTTAAAVGTVDLMSASSLESWAEASCAAATAAAAAAAGAATAGSTTARSYSVDSFAPLSAATAAAGNSNSIAREEKSGIATDDESRVAASIGRLWSCPELNGRGDAASARGGSDNSNSRSSSLGLASGVAVAPAFVAAPVTTGSGQCAADGGSVLCRAGSLTSDDCDDAQCPVGRCSSWPACSPTGRRRGNGGAYMRAMAAAAAAAAAEAIAEEEDATAASTDGDVTPDDAGVTPGRPSETNCHVNHPLLDLIGTSWEQHVATFDVDLGQPQQSAAAVRQQQQQVQGQQQTQAAESSMLASVPTSALLTELIKRLLYQPLRCASSLALQASAGALALPLLLLGLGRLPGRARGGCAAALRTMGHLACGCVWGVASVVLAGAGWLLRRRRNR